MVIFGNYVLEQLEFAFYSFYGVKRFGMIADGLVGVLMERDYIFHHIIQYLLDSVLKIHQSNAVNVDLLVHHCV